MIALKRKTILISLIITAVASAGCLGAVNDQNLPSESSPVIRVRVENSGPDDLATSAVTTGPSDATVLEEEFTTPGNSEVTVEAMAPAPGQYNIEIEYEAALRNESISGAASHEVDTGACASTPGVIVVFKVSYSSNGSDRGISIGPSEDNC